MSRKLVLISGMILLLIGVGLTLRVQEVAASGTIYIRANGLIEGTDKIVSADNIIYTFTDNINDSIVIERDNIVVDGAGYTLQGTGTGTGIYLWGRSNVTIKNITIKAFYLPIGLYQFSNYNTISGSTITDNDYGILIVGSTNNVYGNNITNNGYGIGLLGSGNISINNNIYGNNIAHNSNYGIMVTSNSNISRNTVIANNGDGIVLDASSNNIIYGNNITNNGEDGIGLVDSSSNNTISENNITSNIEDGIGVYQSSNNNTISGNNIAENNGDGIGFYGSHHNEISGNNDLVGNNGTGIYLYDSSNYNTISGNNVTANYDDGIDLEDSSNNTISGNNIEANNDSGIDLGASSNNDIYGNNITENNVFGIVLDASSNNSIYHNNFINNTWSAWVSLGYENVWDNGYPSGGNYRSNYTGVDSDHDGIGDSWHEIDENNIDRHPLMGMYSDFKATSELHVQTICNSTISDFKFNDTAILFNVTGASGSAGFCRICIPQALIGGTYRVFVNDTEILPAPEPLPCSNMTHTYLYFGYRHSTQEVIVIPEFPSFLILPLFMSVTLLTVAIYRRKPKPQT